MKTLIIMRHGQAGDADTDYLRPLTEEGTQQCLQTADELADAGITLDRVLTSSASRARRSAELVSEALGFTGKIEAHRSLYLADPAYYLDAIRNTDASHSTLLLVAHNPGLSHLASRLRGTHVGLKTAGWALVQFESNSWGSLGSH